MISQSVFFESLRKLLNLGRLKKAYIAFTVCLNLWLEKKPKCQYTQDFEQQKLLMRWTLKATFYGSTFLLIQKAIQVF